MKKLALLIALGFIFQGVVSAQNCLPEGITFSTQAQIDSFQVNYPGCTEIEGDVVIEGDDITNLDGLSILTSMMASLKIGGVNGQFNLLLTNISGLNKLISVGLNLSIIHNTSLLSISGFNNLISVGNSMWIGESSSLTSISGFINLTTVGGLAITDNAALPIVSGFNNLASAEGPLTVNHNTALIGLTGLNKLSTVLGSFTIYENPNLTNITGVMMLTSVGQYFAIAVNPLLTSLAGLNELTSIGLRAEIAQNGSLINLTGLENLTSIGEGLVLFENASLTSVTGLENLTSIGDDLTVVNNSLLSTCGIQSICDYLGDPSGEVSISDNAPGCNSQQEVEEACMSVGVSDLDPGFGFSIYPNPASTFITVASPNENAIDQVNIYNQIGKMVQQEQGGASTLNVASLAPGLYIVEIFSGQRRNITKFIVE